MDIIKILGMDFIVQIFDIVEGPMADDQIWDYVEDYMSGKISKAAFWELIKFKYPTHQIVFCTEDALKTLHFERVKRYDEYIFSRRRDNRQRPLFYLLYDRARGEKASSEE